MSSKSAFASVKAGERAARKKTKQPASRSPKTNARKPKSTQDEIYVPHDLLTSLVNENSEEWIPTTEAKKEYFLTPQDLSHLQYESEGGGGIGIGPPVKYYNRGHLLGAALRKHGRSGLREKLQARYKREAKTRLKEKEAHAKLMTAKQQHVTVAPDTKAMKGFRACLLKAARKQLGFEASGAPIKNWRIDVPGVQPQTFAALVGRPYDVKLETFCKRGAFYTKECASKKIFGISSSDKESLKHHFSREGLELHLGYTVTVRFKPSTNELSVIGRAEISGNSDCIPRFVFLSLYE